MELDAVDLVAEVRLVDDPVVIVPEAELLVPPSPIPVPVPVPVPVAVEFPVALPVELPVELAVAFAMVVINEFDERLDVEAVQLSVKKTYSAAHPIPLQPDSQGYSTNSVGMALGQPQDCVTAEIAMQSGVAQDPQMLLVRVTVGQPD